MLAESFLSATSPQPELPCLSHEMGKMEKRIIFVSLGLDSIIAQLASTSDNKNISPFLPSF